LIFALDKLNVRHISTSSLVYRLTKKVSRDAYPAMKVSTKFEVDTTIRCLVIALLLLIRYVILTFDLLTLVSGHTWQVMWSIPPPSLEILRLSVLGL